MRDRKLIVKEGLDHLPIVAILRGVTPPEVVEIGAALHEAGIRVMEVTMNSPDPLECIERLTSAFGTRMAIGAGTVLTAGQVEEVRDRGGCFIVSPNTNPEVISRTAELGLYSLPGAATCSECFAALAAGADALKLFPASVMGPSGLKQLMAVLPREVGLFAVGGVTAENMAGWIAAGARGVGLGSNVFRAGDSAAEVGRKAGLMVSAYRMALEANR